MINFKKIEAYFELCLWKFRLFTLIPVIFGLLSTLNFFVIGSLEIIDGIFYSFEAEYGDDDAFLTVITKVVAGIDHYLIG
ncbi:MAG: YqhA family protein, partial [Halothece sp.]